MLAIYFNVSLLKTRPATAIRTETGLAPYQIHTVYHFPLLFLEQLAPPVLNMLPKYGLSNEVLRTLVELKGTISRHICYWPLLRIASTSTRENLFVCIAVD